MVDREQDEAKLKSIYQQLARPGDYSGWKEVDKEKFWRIRASLRLEAYWLQVRLDKRTYREGVKKIGQFMRRMELRFPMVAEYLDSEGESGAAVTQEIRRSIIPDNEFKAIQQKSRQIV